MFLKLLLEDLHIRHRIVFILCINYININDSLNSRNDCEKLQF